MADLIDRQVFIKGQCNSCDGWCEYVNCDCLNCKSDHRCSFIKELADEPSVDAVEVVRCKDCIRCGFCGEATNLEVMGFYGYCSRGKRREENAAELGQKKR